VSGAGCFVPNPLSSDERAKLEWFQGLIPEGQCQNLALTVLFVASSLESSPSYMFTFAYSRVVLRYEKRQLRMDCVAGMNAFAGRHTPNLLFFCITLKPRVE